ncbi:CCA tRNA nucleotidyltransferase [Rhodovulum sp. FJ3]|uniref:CCA tRNA nucleotidyltransferase n=1 Tax=Rhodovulum sp. FJ3 TaxID=3079053 RepID=UPI00293DD5DA|nr:CCA tRNA nucleotidyltransferase [Rhodovulum sp. FJ3]MDV4169112.1 CCA tRNA nucleotidyltransferase [Rhodovulum sp. FJ3]
MTRIRADWIDRPATRAVTDCLTRAGFQAYFVGGCVRNALIGAPVSDIDIATDALPQQVQDCAAGAGLRQVPTGIEHGTITVVSDGIPHEITTFRRDVETDGRHATVAFSTDLRDDAARRDFTMNALYAAPDGTVVDPLVGIPDLNARRVRFIGDPNARITEDYLRILRFFRFHAWYGDVAQGVDPDGLAACAENLEGLEHLAKERVTTELIKLLSAPDPAPSVASMRVSGVLNALLPGADDRALAPLIHLETAVDAPPNPMRRLAVSGGIEPENHLRLSRAQMKELTDLREMIASTEGPAALGYRYGVDAARDGILARSAMLETVLPPDAPDQIAKGAAAIFPVTAQDLMPDYAGVALGQRLKSLKSDWIASGFRLTRDELLKR